MQRTTALYKNIEAINTIQLLIENSHITHDLFFNLLIYSHLFTFIHIYSLLFTFIHFYLGLIYINVILKFQIKIKIN